MHKTLIILLILLFVTSAPARASYYRVFAEIEFSKSFELGLAKGRVSIEKKLGKNVELNFLTFNKRVVLEIDNSELSEKVEFSSGVLASSSEDENALFVIFYCTAKGRVVFQIQNYSVLNFSNEECEGI